MLERKTKYYGLVSRFNHWITAIGFLGMLGLGFYLAYGGLDGAEKAPLRALHKSVGTVFVLWAFWRVGWRLVHGFPKDISEMPVWQSVAAKLMHWALLISILAMPLSGVLGSVYGGRSVDVFGLLTIPAQSKIEILASASHFVHGKAPLLISGIILLHITAALKHHFVNKDGVLKRMLGVRPV